MQFYKYKLMQTNKFKKQLKKIKKRHNYLKKDYEFVVDTLLQGKQLPEKYKNHILEPKGNRVL